MQSIQNVLRMSLTIKTRRGAAPPVSSRGPYTKVQQIVDTEVKSETSAAVRTELQKFLEQSAKYVVYTRLSMPVDDLDTSSFSFATQYQNRPKVLERLGTLLNHSLIACLSPVRDVAHAMHMTMPPPEELEKRYENPQRPGNIESHR